MAAFENTPTTPRLDVLAAYATDLAILAADLTQLRDLLRLTRKALDVALAESTALADDRDAWREAHSVTLRLLHEAARTNDRLTDQLHECRKRRT